ncbi:hypothetical protein JOC34_000858 [Virgibacillus halotolerans]|nr:hypothetical protein [Virgibacillus halotolerans]
MLQAVFKASSTLVRETIKSRHISHILHSNLGLYGGCSHTLGKLADDKKMTAQHIAIQSHYIILFIFNELD